MSSLPYFFLESNVQRPAAFFPLESSAECIVSQSLNIKVASPKAAEDGDGFVIQGTLEYLDIKLDAALNKELSWFHAMDDYSLELSHLYDVLFGEFDGDDHFPELKDEVADVIERTLAMSNNILYITSAQLADSDLGTAAIELLLDHSAAGIAVVALPGLDVAHPESLEYQIAVSRLASLSRLGFVHIPDSPFLALDLGLERPSLLGNSDSSLSEAA